MAAWLLLVGASLCIGVLRPPWWTVVLCPLISLGLGIYEVGTERPNYDMHGFGYYIGGFFAVLCVAAWFLGRGLVTLARTWSTRR